MGKTIEERAEERARAREEKLRKRAVKKSGHADSPGQNVKMPERELLDALGKNGDPGAGRHRRFRSISSTQQAMPILDVRDDIVVLKDGTYAKLMEFSPINFELRSPSEQDAIIAQFGGVIRTWPKDVHIKVLSMPSNVNTFIEELESCMARESSEECKKLQRDQIDMLKRIGQTQGATRRFFVSFPFEEPGGFRKTPGFPEVKRSLDKQGRSLQTALEGCGNALISSEEKDYTLNALFTSVCKAQSDSLLWEDRKDAILYNYSQKYGANINLNRIPVTDFFAPDQIESRQSPNYMIIDGKYVTYAYLPSNAYPVQAYGGWLQVLFGYMEDVNVDLWVHKESTESILRRLQFELKNKRIQQKNTDDIASDYDDIVSSLESGLYIKQQLANGDDFCYISTILTIYANSEDELNDRFREMRDYCIRNDMNLKRCTFQQDDAFLATIPTSPCNKGIFAKSKRNIMASQLGSCYPFTAYELCDRGGVFLGINARYGSPVFVNMFDTAKYQNANMMIFGPSGSGKTYTLLCMLLRLRQKGTQVYIIAPLKGFEFYRACSAIGGQIIQISPGSAQNINIMEIRRKDTSDTDIIDGIPEDSRGSILVNKIQQLHRFFSLLVPDMSAVEKQILDETLIKTYGRFGITSQNRSLIDPNGSGEYRQMPLLGDLHEDLGASGDDGKRLYNLLTRFVSGSARSFNQPTNVNLNNRFVVIDVSALTEELLPVGMFIALDFVMDQAQADRTKRKIVAIDELWKLMKGSKMSAEFVVEVFKIIRGYAGAAIGATQDLADVLENESGAAIINNSKTKLLLPMDKKEAEAVAKVIDLTSEEMKQLKRTEVQSATGKRKASKALMVANSNHIFINIKASRKEHDLITTSADDLNRIKSQLSVRS